MRSDLQDRADVATLVDAFYRRALADPLIGPIFTDVARIDLDHHVPIITDFWATSLLREGHYGRDLLALHAALDRRAPLRDEHFGRWLELWAATVDDRFSGPVADRAKEEARRVAAAIQRRLQGRSGSAFETLVPRAGCEPVESGGGGTPRGSVSGS